MLLKNYFGNFCASIRKGGFDDLLKFISVIIPCWFVSKGGFANPPLPNTDLFCKISYVSLLLTRENNVMEEI
jgi:hypothetical protein